MEHPISTQALDYFDQLYPLDQSDLQPTVRPMPTVRRSERRTANRENIKMSSELSPAKPSANQALSNAKIAKQDEFYTQYIDIQKEVEAYLEFDCDRFRDKVVYCKQGLQPHW